MGYPAEVMETQILEAEIESALKERAAPALTLVKIEQANTSLHGGVFKALALIYAALLAVFWLTFAGDKEALFMVAISAVYLAAYMGTPFMLSRVGGRVDPVQEKSFAAFLKEPFETWTGVVSGREAMLQILLVPSAVLIAGAGMGLIIAMSR
ncbi:hypothetical protein [Hyphococcus luteus]|uniref:Uncharacterized protein n=1 Tax=Hyphococcus luteus TaxID=2058213 RepID=A0A2S7K2U1_9PROT|nr:hypothetical protein [Marinicaulis flavus]PQA86824.1 hypothetical protein CW354_15190 [Marinicaulis flavus]